MEILIISITAFLASILTFFSGFGLGTILLPVFAVFFPIDIAVALTGIVHLLNNIFKMTLVGFHAKWQIVLKFGLPAILAALLGAWTLVQFSGDTEIYSYSIWNRRCSITPIKLIISLLMFGFAIIEILPFYKKLEFAQKHLVFGGLLSGFFGGLSGHQGALRSAFLIKVGMTKEAFIATGVIIASLIDISRIPIYFSGITNLNLFENSLLFIVPTLAAFIGAVIGKKMLKKVTIDFVHHIVVALIMVLSILLGAGII